MTIQNISDIPAETLVSSFISAMAQHGAPTCVVYLVGTKAMVQATNPAALATARNAILVKDGALEAAAVALHTFRFVHGEGGAIDEAMNRCALHACAVFEEDKGKAQSWDELPEEVKEAHRLFAGSVIAAALAHNPTPESKIIKV